MMETRNEPTDWELAEIGLAHSRVVFLSGRPGVGKSYAAIHYATNGREVVSTTMTPETPSAESRGMYMPKGGEFIWSDGLMVRAMLEGARLIINEISHASEDVLAFLYPVLESPETARVTLPNGATIAPAEGFQCVVTDNHDIRTLLPALQSRLITRVHIERPHPDAIALLPERYRRAAEKSFDIDEHDPRATTLRAWQNVGDLTEKGVDERTAFLLTFGRGQGQMVWESVALSEAK